LRRTSRSLLDLSKVDCWSAHNDYNQGTRFHCRHDLYFDDDASF
jgi:hypothetical protein